MITSVSSPQWANEQKTAINCLITTDATGNEQLPFTASPVDPEPSGRKVFEDCVNGVYGPIAEYVEPPSPPVPPPTAEQNKQEAVKRLQTTDWVTQVDVINPSSGPKLLNQAAFLSYRVAVRQLAVYPQAGIIDWPVRPDEVWGE